MKRKRILDKMHLKFAREHEVRSPHGFKTWRRREARSITPESTGETLQMSGHIGDDQDHSPIAVQKKDVLHSDSESANIGGQRAVVASVIHQVKQSNRKIG